MSEKIKRVDFSNRFTKYLKKAPLEIKIAFKNRYKLFILNQFHPQLNNHSLKGKLFGYRNINITGDWRAIYSAYLDKNGDNNVVRFELLGTHSQLYK